LTGLRVSSRESYLRTSPGAFVSRGSMAGSRDSQVGLGFRDNSLSWSDVRRNYTFEQKQKNDLMVTCKFQSKISGISL
jgi:hypothetical protein